MASNPRAGWPQKLALGVVGLLAVAQLVRPERIDPPVEADKTVEHVAQPAPALLATLRRACYDCHSNETTWPWYSQVAPVSWKVAEHVRDGRRHLNFSDWVRMTTGKKRKVVGEICDEVKEGGMPLDSYLWVHGDARLSPGDIQAICDWTMAEQQRLAAADPKP